MPEPLEPGSQGKVGPRRAPPGGSDAVQPGWCFQSRPPAACLALHHVQDSFKVSCAMAGGGGGLKTTFGTLLGPVITDHCLGVLAGLF